MLYITREGHVDAERIKVKIFTKIERRAMKIVNGIVVHQTDGSSADSAFDSYKREGANGAHFLIDKDGSIYQTASLYKTTNHVGMAQSRCLNTQRCAPSEFKATNALEKAWKPKAISDREYKKQWPDRYPLNMDSIGIEIVGVSTKISGRDEKVYEAVNEKQNDSLEWLIRELTDTLSVAKGEIYRHPDIARKNTTEASTARW